MNLSKDLFINEFTAAKYLYKLNKSLYIWSNSKLKTESQPMPYISVWKKLSLHFVMEIFLAYRPILEQIGFLVKLHLKITNVILKSLNWELT